MASRMLIPVGWHLKKTKKTMYDFQFLRRCNIRFFSEREHDKLSFANYVFTGSLRRRRFYIYKIQTTITVSCAIKILQTK